uniref:glucuronosyltransferase n=1 Tax=Acrobeloides nanus TaxID=290746 RepID=A0A914CL17_9BILA
MDHMAWILGVPTPLSYVPIVGELSISDKPSYFERLWNIVQYVGDVYTYRQGIEDTTRIFREHYGDNFPDIEQIAKNSSITFVVADEILDFPRPILHNMVFIGGLGHENSRKELQEPYKSEMEKGKKGVVYFSLGSIVNTNFIPKEVKKNLFAAFESLSDYHFLVKIDQGDQESENMAKSIPNLFISQWAPQQDILAHPRLKAFATHGGYNSLIESARMGVPIITIPFFADQFRNGKLAERNGWGVTFEKKLLLHGYDEFLSVLKQILENSSYYEKAQRTKRLLYSKPFTPAEKLIKYTQTHLWVSSNSIMDHMAWILGVPTPLSYIPIVGELSISDKPSYFERLWNIVQFIGDVYTYRQGIEDTTRIFREHYGDNFPDIEQIAKNSPIAFVVADEILDFPRPILHNIVFIGGLGHENSQKELQEPYKSEMEKGKKGVIYFSLGSAVNTNFVPKEVKKNLFAAFESLSDYHFLVKIDQGDQESENMAKSIPNLFIFQWAPQQDILAHPRLKAFATHGNGTNLSEKAQQL